MPCKFESIEEARRRIVEEAREYRISYKGKVMFLTACHPVGGDSRLTATSIRGLPREEYFKYDTFDEMLDNFMVGDKRLRDIILKANIEIEL